MTKPAPLPANLAHRPFTLQQAKTQGISVSRSRASDLWTPSRGIRIPKSAVFNALENARPYTTLENTGVVSHFTAARIHGLYLPSWCRNDESLHITRPPDVAEPRRKRVHGHRMNLPDSDIVRILGVPVTNISRTLLDLAPLLSLDDLVTIVDQIVCEHHREYTAPTIALVRYKVLNAYIGAHHRMRGLRTLREAMGLSRVGADSPRETRLRLIIARSPLPEFKPNVEIQNAAGRSLVSPDLACEEYKTCVEYDGEHHTTAEQRSKDHDRDYITEFMAWHQVLINKEDMFAGDFVVVTKVARMLVRGGWTDPSNLAGRSLRGFLSTRKDFG